MHFFVIIYALDDAICSTKERPVVCILFRYI